MAHSAKAPVAASNHRLVLIIGIAVVLSSGMFLLLQTAGIAYDLNGRNGFPLDDPWIHLQFAQNLLDYGVFSYYQDQQITSGSTSPLYTGLLAAGMVFTEDEFLLSYVLGGVFLLVSASLMFRLAELLFGHRLPSSLAVMALVAFEPRLIWISLSGMETTLFIGLLLAVYLFYLEQRPVLLGVSVGILLWARPEALLMIGVLCADALYHRNVARGKGIVEDASRVLPPKELFQSLVIASIFGTGYTLFNLVLSGSLLPNTFAAKIKYYSNGGGAFPSQLLQFLSAEHMMTIAPFLVVGALGVIYAVAKRRAAPLLIPLLWSTGMIAVYWWKLPYLYQYGRYLMPILPFLFLLAISGLESILEIARARFATLRIGNVREIIRAGVVLVMVGSTAFASWTRRSDFAESCRYITQRHVATAEWVRDHLPADAVLATHDVGALAYYSGRRVVDMVGLISPEAIDLIGKTEDLLDFLQTQKVTHLVVLRSWFEITNVHPLMNTDEMRPEVMEVFLFDPARMHFTSRIASRLSERARMELAAGNLQQAVAMLETALHYDGNSAPIHLLLGQTLMLEGRLDDADREFRIAIMLQGDLWDARFGRAEVAARRQKPLEAIALLESLITDNPTHRGGYWALAQLYKDTGTNEVRAAYCLRRFNEMSVEPEPVTPR